MTRIQHRWSILSAGSGSGSGSPLTLPTDGVLDNAVIAYVDNPVRVTANSILNEVLTVPEGGQTIEVSIGAMIAGTYTPTVTQTFTIPAADYSAVASMAISLNEIADGSGFVFGADSSGLIYVENDPEIYPKTDNMRVVVVGGTALAGISFTAGQYADAEPGEWYAVDNFNLSAVVELDERLRFLELNGAGGGGGLSSVRKRRSGYVYHCGPNGSMGTGVPTLGTATAHIIRNMGAGQVIDAVGMDLTTTNVNELVFDFYVANSNANYEFPSIIVSSLGSLTIAAGQTSGTQTMISSTPYTIEEDGDYFIICVLRSGTVTASSFRMHQGSTTVSNDTETVGATSFTTIGRVGYNYPSFPTEVTVGTTAWTVQSLATVMPRLYFRMGAY